MARRLRLHVPGGFYHVTLRGNHRQPIFFADADRDLLDSAVAEAVDRLADCITWPAPAPGLHTALSRNELPAYPNWPDDWGAARRRYAR